MSDERATAEILSFGEELVLGEIADTNATHMAARLSELGLRVRRTCAVGDRLDEMKRALGEAISRSQLVVTTGGLGPTSDDLTRQAVSEVTGAALEYHPEVVESIARRFNRPLDSIRANNRSQAYIPAGSRIIENPVGTAPGFMIESGGAVLFALPGVPHEMRRMFADSVEPHAREHLARRAVVQRRLHLTGLGESEIDRRLDELIQPGREPAVGTKVSYGLCTVRIVATGASEAEARAAASECEGKIRERLGEHIFGADFQSLEHGVVMDLAGRGLTVAVAESCTGGLVGALITSVPGSSAVLLESVVAYSNDAKARRLRVRPELIAEQGAVSAPVAEAMARGARESSGADMAVSVTGIAGPAGGTPEKPVGTVYLGVASARGTRSVHRKFHPPRDAVRRRSANTAMYLLLEEAAAVDGGSERGT